MSSKFYPNLANGPQTASGLGHPAIDAQRARKRASEWERHTHSGSKFNTTHTDRQRGRERHTTRHSFNLLIAYLALFILLRLCSRSLSYLERIKSIGHSLPSSPASLFLLPPLAHTGQVGTTHTHSKRANATGSAQSPPLATRQILAHAHAHTIPLWRRRPWQSACEPAANLFAGAHNVPAHAQRRQSKG